MLNAKMLLLVAGLLGLSACAGATSSGAREPVTAGYVQSSASDPAPAATREARETRSSMQAAPREVGFRGPSLRDIETCRRCGHR